MTGGESWCLDGARPPGWNYDAQVRRQWIGDLALVDCACDPCYLDTLAATLPELSASAASAARNATLELFLGAVRPDEPIDSATLGPALRSTMERWIDRHLTDQQITPAAVAAAHAV